MMANGRQLLLIGPTIFKPNNDLWCLNAVFYDIYAAYNNWNSNRPYLDGVASSYYNFWEHGYYTIGYYQPILGNSTKAVPQRNPMEYMGDGWNLKFNRVSIQNSSGYSSSQIFLHLEDGSTFQYELKANSSNLKNYPARDIEFTLDPSSAGMPGSRYILTYHDGSKEYFDVNGHIIRRADRFANQYNFAYASSGTYNGTITITDATGATAASIVYTSSLVTVNLPDSTTVKYGLTASNNARILSTKNDQLNRQTTFGYSYQPATYNYTAQNLTNGIAINQHLLSSVTYPTGAVSSYTYVKTEGFIEKSGRFEYYRLGSRQDTADGSVSNYAAYSYSADNYAGYPNQSNTYPLPTNYTYETTVSYNTNKKVTYTFNNNHLIIKKVTSEASTAKAEETYTYDANNHPTSFTEKISQGGNNRTATEYFDFDVYGNMLGYWSRLAANASDAEHKTTYTYGAYGIPLTKSYKTNASTTVTVTNTLSAAAPTAGKTIDSSMVSQNGVGNVGTVTFFL